jgi:hypothetical protein
MMKKVQIEYDGSMKKKRVDVTKKQGGRQVRTMEMVDVKDPKCWEIITIENSILYSPGYRLTKRQVESLCRGNKYEVVIGGPGQFTPHKSRY